MEENKSLNSNNIIYVIITGIIYIITAKGIGSGISFLKEFVISFLNFFGGLTGLGDWLYSSTQNDLLATEPYFWFILFFVSSVLSMGVSYYLSSKGFANKATYAAGTAFSQLIIGRIFTLQRVTIQVQVFLIFIAFGVYIVYCQKMRKSFLFIGMAPILVPWLVVLSLFPFVLVASKLPDFLAVLVSIIGLIIAVFIFYPLVSNFYYKHLIRIDASICNFSIIWVIGVLVICLIFGNQPQYSTSEIVNGNEIKGTEYHNSTTDEINYTLEISADWLSEGEYNHGKDGEDGSTKASFPDASIKEQVIYNDSRMEITSVSLRREAISKDKLKSDKTWDEMVLTIDILNKENEEERYFLKNYVVMVNDCITVPAYFTEIIKADEKATVNIGIDTTYLNNFGITRIGDIKFRIEKYNLNFEDPFVTEFIDVKTSLCDQADTVLVLENAIDFYSGGGISIKGRYVDSFGIYEQPGLLMLIDNNTVHDLNAEVDDITVNNTMQEWLSFDQPVEVIRGTKAIWFSFINPSDSGRLSIETLDEIEFSLSISDKETCDSIANPHIRLKKSNNELY